MFIAILFIIALDWKQPKFPTTDERISKLGYICTMKDYSASRGNEPPPYVIEMNLEQVMPRKVVRRKLDAP